ncbi:MAG: methylated-DNA--[protein]-cysteine S-methyltransferase [Magnetococcales bacterium]|nr:methylated-DNA--[protein]-cysteine S-methyltransferase [Magnetococcales bacterium]
MWLHTRDHAIVALSPHAPVEPPEEGLRVRVEEWLADYFAGHIRSVAGLPLAPVGTPFRLRVWERLQAIPPGRVESYGSLARVLGSSPRAVGMALAANPIPILIPCHRVVAADGPGGYSGARGVEGKRFLLRLEGVVMS